MAREERKRISLLFVTARYETARQEIQGMLTHVEDGEREFWQAMAALIEGYGDWDNFNPRSAKNKLGRAFTSSNRMRVAHVGSNQRWRNWSWTWRPIWSF